MKHREILLLLLVTSAAVVHAQGFEGLDSIVVGELRGTWHNGQKYDLQRKVLFDSTITEVINVPVGNDIIDLIITQIDRENPDKFLVKHWPGPSDDPIWMFYRFENADTVLAGKLGADVVIIPGDGFVYTQGRTDREFNMHRKYRLVEEKLVEVKQPFYWVGIESQVARDVVLYSDTSMVDTVVQLYKGMEVTVLVNRGKFYLLKTSSGLTGWASIKNDDGRTIPEIYFLGD